MPEAKNDYTTLISSLKAETKQLNSIRVNDADKKLRSYIYSDLGNKSKNPSKFAQRVLGQFVYSSREKTKNQVRMKNMGVKKQKERESLDQFWAASGEMAKK